jgi:hypothetical protein
MIRRFVLEKVLGLAVRAGFQGNRAKLFYFKGAKLIHVQTI